MLWNHLLPLPVIFLVLHGLVLKVRSMICLQAAHKMEEEPCPYCFDMSQAMTVHCSRLWLAFLLPLEITGLSEQNMLVYNQRDSNRRMQFLFCFMRWGTNIISQCHLDGEQSRLRVGCVVQASAPRSIVQGSCKNIYGAPCIIVQALLSRFPSTHSAGFLDTSRL
jgi:hypothetical protein